jgi:hypothetical protein
MQGDKNSNISEFLYEIRRFILRNRQILEIAPLQLYSSGLIFAPRMTIIREKFKGDLPSWICKFPKVEET